MAAAKESEEELEVICSRFDAVHLLNYYCRHLSVGTVLHGYKAEQLCTEVKYSVYTAAYLAFGVQVKYLEMSNVCNDFLEMAKHLAATVIDEINFYVVNKTVTPSHERSCRGRGFEGNRGQSRKRYTYEAFNICLKICCNDDGLFNGNDECAAKEYGGREVLGALEYMKQYQPGESKHQYQYQ